MSLVVTRPMVNRSPLAVREPSGEFAKVENEPPAGTRCVVV